MTTTTETKTRTYYLVYVANYWGSGFSLDAAKAECKRAGGRVNESDGWMESHWQVPADIETDKLPYMDESGSVCHYPKTGTTRGPTLLHRDRKTYDMDKPEEHDRARADQIKANARKKGR